MKELYTEPELTIIEIVKQDIITESSGDCYEDDFVCEWEF